ncbi:MAG: non-heme iron oxygenase ferredoxin subunit [Anaerolineae bacterium]|nr:non-heme iron oxygenase ferredoxin subunit [Anaerolineae bacterium]
MADLIRVAALEDVPPGGRLVVEVRNVWIVIFNVGGRLYAVEDICTHDDGPLAEGELDDHEIMCPRHGARFDIRTGRVLSMPATKPVRRFEVRAEGNDVLVEV